MSYSGEFAALGPAVCWAGSANLFATAAGTMGSRILNRLRITAAWVFLTVAFLAIHRTAWPTWASAPATLALALSGMIGFIFGDTFQFRSIMILGPGRASLLSATAPLFTTALAWPLLQQRPGPLALLGMMLTVSGTAFGMSGPAKQRGGHDEGGIAVGIGAGLLGAVGQAGGYVLSKLALKTGLDPLSGTLIRVGCASIAVWIITGVERQVEPTLAALRDVRSTLFMLGGAFLGPCL